MFAITSFIPNLDFSHPAIPPHNAPAIAAQSKVSGIWIIAGKSKPAPTKTATKEPTINCPSAPMLNRPVLNANAIDKPVSINGVALIIVHAIYLGFPIIPSINAA